MALACPDAGALSFIKRGGGPARATGTGPSSRPGRRAPRRAASTRGGPDSAEASCRPAPGCGRPSWHCSGRKRRHSWSSSTHLPASGARRGRS